MLKSRIIKYTNIEDFLESSPNIVIRHIIPHEKMKEGDWEYNTFYLILYEDTTHTLQSPPVDF